MKNSLLLSFLLLSSFAVSAQPTVGQQAFTHKNLSLFLLQGSDQLSQSYLTLEEAMKAGSVVLHETGSVNELSIDNKSNSYVFIMAGDIVKGGKQDRTIAEDIVLSPKSKGIALKSFCVEQSRWQQRGGEKVSEFSSSTQMLSNRNLKVAARKNKSQGAVWSEVSTFQSNVGSNVRSNVRSTASASSLQLTLEDKNVQKSVKEYIAALQPAFDGKKNVQGVVFCVNGKISTVEWFGNAELFGKLQAKLLESAANEALFALDSADKNEKTQLTADAIDNFMRTAMQGVGTDTKTSKGMLERKYETDESIAFVSYHTDISRDAPLHVSIYSTKGIDVKDNSIQNQSIQYGGYRSINRN